MNFFEQIGAFFASLPAELYVFIISILPIVELRGAIPVGAALGLEYYINYPLAVIGNMLPIPFILLFIPKILDFLARFKAFKPIVEWLRKKADKHSSKVLGKDGENKSDEAAFEGGEATEATEATLAGEPTEKEEKPAALTTERKMSRGIFTALLIFVAIPLPGTGAWTGSLIAALFNLPKKWSFLAILLGVLISGVIMSLASYGVLGFLEFLL